MSDQVATEGSISIEQNVTSPAEDVYVMPCSYAQQRLWFLDQWQAGTAAYNIPLAVHLVGSLSADALDSALNELVERHESLRTSFVVEDAEPIQRIVAQAGVELTLVDVSAGEGAQEQGLRLAEEFARRPFDLTVAPLLRALLIRLSAQEHFLVLVIHHIASDGWSMGVLLSELSALYQAHIEGQPAPLPALPIQYADYALWQRERLRGQLLEDELGYWRKRLEDLSTLVLPSDRPRPPTPSYRGASRPIVVGAELTEALKRLGRAQQCTLFMTLLAAFATLLARYSGQEDIAVGSPIAGRNHSQLEGLIGFFVNTLVLRTDMSGNPSFRELLGRVRESALDAYAHQELPFEKLVEELKPERDPSRNPLVQVMFALQNAPAGQLSLPGVRCSPVKLSTDTAKFDLTLLLSEHPDGLRGHLGYATDLFDASTIDRMAGHWQVLLEGIVANPAQAISQLPLLSQAEREQILLQWNDTAVDYPKDTCVHELFEQQAERTPKAIAVIYEGAQLSYAQLNARANQLAYHLRALGVGPEVRVGICAERSIELVVALLAILKAGGAYVPLDPAYPKQRLAFMLEDAQPAVLLTHSQLLQNLPQHSLPCVCLDRDWPSITTRPETNLSSSSRSHNLAYLIYTSGSTGSPKAVMVTHQSVTRLVCNSDYIQLGTHDVVAQISNASFDAMTFEVWGAWVAGARLVIIAREVLLSPHDLTAELDRRCVTTLFVTTALFNEIVRHLPAAFAGIKQVLFGGEAADPTRVREALQAGPPERLLHVYGPTESTTFATWQQVTQVEEGALTVSIGRPIANTRTYVLDRCMQPLPVGVPGELYLGGDGLARGYWERPELSAEKFVKDPFSSLPGTRLYRTGDRVRWRYDGALEFLGRMDQQIKIRGFRIEPGEIEALLGQHPGVRQALVTLREDFPGDKRLVAYVVGESVQTDALRHKLRERLPEYMLPSAIVLLPTLPLTPNGKLDRSKLPAPPTGSADGAGNPVPPRNSIERHLAKIWEDLLDRQAIGVSENFFDLGGHSLLAPQLMDRIQRTFGQRLPLDTLWFHAGTIEALAKLLQDKGRSDTRPDLVPIKDGSRRPLFVVHTMGGNLFHYYDLARYLDADQSVFGLRARGVYGDSPPDTSIPAIAMRCVDAVRRVQPKGPYLIAGFSSGGVVAYEIARQLHASGDTVAMLALLDSFTPRARTSKRWGRWRSARLSHFVTRELQERLYFALLHPLKLDRLRALRTAGEAHRWAHWSYRPQPYPGLVDLFLAEGSEGLCTDPDLGWRRLVTGTLRIHRLPGSHGLLVKPPVVVELARELQLCMNAIDGD